MSLSNHVESNETLDLFSELSPALKQELDLRAMVASKVHLHRISLKLTQKEFAAKYHLSQSLVSKWENGEANLSTKTLFRIASICNCELTMVEKKTPPAQLEKATSNMYSKNVSTPSTSIYKNNGYKYGGNDYALVF